MIYPDIIVDAMLEIIIKCTLTIKLKHGNRTSMLRMHSSNSLSWLSKNNDLIKWTEFNTQNMNTQSHPIPSSQNKNLLPSPKNSIVKAPAHSICRVNACLIMFPPAMGETRPWRTREGWELPIDMRLSSTSFPLNTLPQQSWNFNNTLRIQGYCQMHPILNHLRQARKKYKARMR